MDLIWTKDTPTREGWYWYKKDATIKMVFIRYLSYCDDYEIYQTDEIISSCVGLWAGPIPLPKD